MDHTHYQELLAKYLNGDCTDEERALLDQWVAALDSEVALPATEEEKKQLIAANWHQLTARTVQNRPSVRRLHQGWYRLVAAAAGLVLLLGIGWYVSKNVFPAPIGTKKALAVKSALVVRVNSSAVAQQLTLSDSSRVTLEPGSSLQYPEVFGGTQREVTLEGEAFFAIQKNPNKPFLVYTNDLVTKVLGTSFRIKTNPETKNITVVVRTGKVSVYSPRLATLTASKSDPETIGVVLTPNQQVTYLHNQSRLVKSLVEKPVVLVPVADLSAFTFQNEPISRVLAAIEKVYGVDIVYDEEVMGNCFITTSLDSEDLYSKLTIICKLLGATYKEIDAQIVITGQGCQ